MHGHRTADLTRHRADGGEGQSRLEGRHNKAGRKNRRSVENLVATVKRYNDFMKLGEYWITTLGNADQYS